MQAWQGRVGAWPGRLGRLGLTVLLGLLAACATPPPWQPIALGAPVAVVASRGAQPAAPVTIRNQALGNGMLAGAGSGTVVGGLWGLACGPFAPLCVPLGATAGLITGFAVGAAVGVTGALSQDEAARLRDRLARAEQGQALVDTLRQAVADRADGVWTPSADPAATQVVLAVQDLALTSTRDARIGITLQVLVTVRPGRPALQPAADRHKRYTHVGPLVDLGAWLDVEGEFLDTALRSACRQLAEQIVADLTPR